MAGVEPPVGALIRRCCSSAAIVLVALLVVGWLVIRRDLRPLEQMTRRAEAISAGDLSQRVGVPHDGPRSAGSGTAFDAMLDQIQGALRSQQRALVAKDAARSSCASSWPTPRTSCARR